MTTDLPEIGRTVQLSKKSDAADDLIQPVEIACARFMKGHSPLATTRKAALLMLREAMAKADQRDHTHRITKRALRGLHKGNERLQDVVERVVSTIFSIPNLSSRGRESRLTMPLFSMVNIEDSEEGAAWIEYKINEEVRQLLITSNLYSRLSLMAISALDSRYAVTLYQLGAAYCGRNYPSLQLTIPELRDQLGIPKGSYSDWAQIRRRVLAQAASEINQIAHFTLTWTEKRQGRRVIAVDLHFYAKNEEKQRLAALEAMRPKNGRKARRTGTVENIINDHSLDVEEDDEIPW